MKELKEIGFYYVLVGLEATTDKYLNNYHKLIKVDDNIECVNFMNEIGINNCHINYCEVLTQPVILGFLKRKI